MPRDASTLPDLTTQSLERWGVVEVGPAIDVCLSVHRQSFAIMNLTTCDRVRIRVLEKFVRVSTAITWSDNSGLDHVLDLQRQSTSVGRHRVKIIKGLGKGNWTHAQRSEGPEKRAWDECCSVTGLETRCWDREPLKLLEWTLGSVPLLTGPLKRDAKSCQGGQKLPVRRGLVRRLVLHASD